MSEKGRLMVRNSRKVVPLKAGIEALLILLVFVEGDWKAGLLSVAVAGVSCIRTQTVLIEEGTGKP